MIEQIAIALTGVVAIFLSQSKSEKARKYACLFGLAGQPFWFWSAYSAEQWEFLFSVSSTCLLGSKDFAIIG